MIENLIAGAIMLAVAALTAHVWGHITWKTLCALCALSAATLALCSIHEGYYSGALINSGVTAFTVWQWWRDGGDDDTKRRLRSAGKIFSPVRRTAPVSA